MVQGDPAQPSPQPGAPPLVTPATPGPSTSPEIQNPPLPRPGKPAPEIQNPIPTPNSPDEPVPAGPGIVVPPGTTVIET